MSVVLPCFDCRMPTHRMAKSRIPDVRRKREALGELLDRLEKTYGRPVWKRRGRGVDVLVRMMLSQNTNATNAASGYKQLTRRFARWDDVLTAPVDQVQRQIAVCGLARMRARRLQALLRMIRDE